MNILNLAQAEGTPPAPGQAPSSGGSSATATQGVASTGLGGSGTTGAPNPIMSILPLALMIGVVYFLMIRPQQKKVKEHQGLLEKIQQGDEVVTNGGMFGRVTGVTPKVLTLEVADGVRVKLLKSQVASVNPKLD